MSKRGYHHGDLRNALIEAATRQVRDGGVDGFSLREAARAVGVSPNAAYRHFSDKSALLAAVATAGFAELSRSMRRAQSRADGPVAQLEATGRAYARFAFREPERFRLMFGAERPREVATETSYGPTPYELLGEALDALVEAGEVGATGRDGAELVAWSMVHGFADLVLAGALTFPSTRARDAALEDVLARSVAALTG